MNKVVCEQCQMEGKQSKVYPSEGEMVLDIGSEDYYDKDGRFHNHDPSTRIRGYSCSEGHEWEKRRGGSCWCGWSSEPYVPQQNKKAMRGGET